MAHKDIRIEFEVTMDKETRRYEAVGFLNNVEECVSVDDVFLRVPNAIGEEDVKFLSGWCTRFAKIPNELSTFQLFTGLRSFGSSHRSDGHVLYFHKDYNGWGLGHAPLGWYYFDNVLVLRRCVDGGVRDKKAAGFSLYCFGGPGLISHLVDSGGPWGCKSLKVNDDNFPTALKENVIMAATFRIISGTELKSGGGFVWRDEVEAKFREMGMRFSNAAEALLVLAKDHKIGRGNLLVAFIQGSQDAFLVGERNMFRELYLDQRASDDNPNTKPVYYDPHCDFLGVCE